MGQGLNLSITVNTLHKFSRQRSFFIEIETSNDVRSIFLIAITGLGATHDSFMIRFIESMPMPAHPSNLSSGVTGDQSIIRHIFSYDRSCADKGVAPDRYTTYNGSVGTDG